MRTRIIGLFLCLQVIACTTHHHHHQPGDGQPGATAGAGKCDLTGQWTLGDERWTLADDNGPLRVTDAAENDEVSVTDASEAGRCAIVLRVMRNEVPQGSGDYSRFIYELTAQDGSVSGVMKDCHFGTWHDPTMTGPCPESKESSQPVSGQKAAR